MTEAEFNLLVATGIRFLPFFLCGLALLWLYLFIKELRAEGS